MEVGCDQQYFGGYCLSGSFRHLTPHSYFPLDAPEDMSGDDVMSVDEDTSADEVMSVDEVISVDNVLQG